MTNLSGNNWDITFADAAKTLGDLVYTGVTATPILKFSASKFADLKKRRGLNSNLEKPNREEKHETKYHPYSFK